MKIVLSYFPCVVMYKMGLLHCEGGQGMLGKGSLLCPTVTTIVGGGRRGRRNGRNAY